MQKTCPSEANKAALKYLFLVEHSERFLIMVK